MNKELQIDYETNNTVDHQSTLLLPNESVFRTCNPYFRNEFIRATFKYSEGPIDHVTLGRREPTLSTEENIPQTEWSSIYSFKKDANHDLIFTPRSELKALLNLAIPSFGGVAKHLGNPDHKFTLSMIGKKVGPDETLIALNYDTTESESPNPHVLKLYQKKGGSCSLGLDNLNPITSHTLPIHFKRMIDYLENEEFNIFLKLSELDISEDDIFARRKAVAMEQIIKARSVSEVYSALGWVAGNRGDMSGKDAPSFELWPPKDQWSSLRAGNL